MIKAVIILVGGKSRRMGQNKAFLDYEGITFIEAALQKFQDYEERIIVADDCTFYQYPNVRTVQDLYPDSGPFCGLYTGLLSIKADRCVVLTVDTPFLKRALMDYLWSVADDADAVIPVVGEQLHPYCAVYNKSALPQIKRAFEAGERRVLDMLNQLKVKEIDEEGIQQFGNPAILLSNLNTREEYLRAMKK